MILERMRQLYPELSKSQRKLADYLVTSYHDAAFMTASRLAETVGVNEATVIRFAQRLGYRGFPEMLEAVQSLVYRDLEPGVREGPPGVKADPLVSAVAAQAAALQRAAGRADADVLDRVRRLLATAASIVVVGQGLAEPLARYVSVSLASIGRPASSPSIASPELADALLRAREDTVLIGISLVAANDRVARVLDRGRRQGARTVALSRSPISPTAQTAEFALALGGAKDESGLVGGALMVLADALLHGLRAQLSGDAAQYTERLESTREYVLTGHEAH